MTSSFSISIDASSRISNPRFQGGSPFTGVGYPFSPCQTKLRGLSVESLKRSNNWASNALLQMYLESPNPPQSQLYSTPVVAVEMRM